MHKTGMAASKPAPLRWFGKILAVVSVVLAQLLISWPPTPAHAVTCTFDSAPSLPFGTYDITNASPTDSVGTINITCSGNPGGQAKLSAGSGTYAQRHMLNGANVLNYQIYTSSALTKVWGDGSAGTGTVAFKSISNAVPVYGRIPALQSVQPGLYSDSIVVTISF